MGMLKLTGAVYAKRGALPMCATVFVAILMFGAIC
jgi:hypothetical protein